MCKCSAVGLRKWLRDQLMVKEMRERGFLGRRESIGNGLIGLGREDSCVHRDKAGFDRYPLPSFSLSIDIFRSWHRLSAC